MTAEEFVKGFYLEKRNLLELYFSPNPTTDVGQGIISMKLNEQQRATIRSAIEGALRDMCYTILLGLDGEAQIGGKQEMYKLYDEKDNELTGSGEIEGYAWEYFHNK